MKNIKYKIKINDILQLYEYFNLIKEINTDELIIIIFELLEIITLSILIN